ncbi:MAG TPA: divalent-cation tolerance protein CutA [Thiobacillus sp.]|jgi:periplasmic divalent cation tolerance protein|nr:divalent-cation tolerance protein CutA [Gammaproteobacteria bacterium]OYZ27553.1 MAG: divalent-cation tolerance protein CutA [Hydrogenophilales bacterium 16-64-40]OZA32893.1 MAG: divalent-cation tolerance protein CutA [Hydrogenophilales bacterium 17-64-65]HQS81366.1 divalent-cation tolerance protein CutA [Thiobacillus sp.]HQT32728.1 divalent-cation tolerance protein CutA [Thiobacillus sp.]
MEPLLILTNLPDAASAEKLARALIECRAAACVNVLPSCRSIYRWQGAVEVATEIPLLIKATRAAYPLVEEIIRTQHPYDVPELIAISITDGLPAYLNWLAAETEKHDQKK